MQQRGVRSGGRPDGRGHEREQQHAVRGRWQRVQPEGATRRDQRNRRRLAAARALDGAEREQEARGQLQAGRDRAAPSQCELGRSRAWVTPATISANAGMASTLRAIARRGMPRSSQYPLQPAIAMEEDRCTPRPDPVRPPMRGGLARRTIGRMTKHVLIAPLLALLLVAPGCGGSNGSARNKSGAAALGRPHVLDLEATDAGSPEAQYFARRVQAHSGGWLTVRLNEDYSASTPANEARLARALRAGQASFGLLPARAWAPAGVKAFDALLAPFVLGTYGVARTAVAGPAGHDLKRALADAGLVPLELVPAELRRVLSARSLRVPDAFADLRIRIPDNPTAAAVLRALGAQPVQGVTASRTGEELQSRRLAGVETAPMFAISNGYGRFAPHITDFALYDRVDTLVAAPGAWRRLSAGQQSAVRAAARDTVAYSATLAQRDARDLAELCRHGARVTAIGEPQLDAIAKATEPLLTSLRRDPVIGPILTELEATPGAGPRLLPVPADCSAPGA
jgi:TRAP-type C4-dicarboxylate transport system substrate-binding protein